MDDNCPSTPLRVQPGRNSKSPNVAISSPESDGRKSPGSRRSPDTRCAICLGKLNNKAFTDICLHQFCFQCLMQWSKVKPECPLCKQPIKSIIYNVRSNLDYDQYNVERRTDPAYVVSEILHSYDFDLVPVDTRVRYRSTMTREYFGELGFLAGARTSYQVPNFAPQPNFHIPPSSTFTPASERRTSRSGSDFRRRIYEEDLWVRDLVDISGRYRECTPQFYRENPAQIHRIIPWLNREINSLMDNNESYTAYILDRILSFLPQYSIRSLEFRSVVEPYFGPRTDHFIHEFYTFSRSVYDISGFDENASYVPNPNYATEVQDVSSNDDSEVEVIRNLRERDNTPTSTRPNNTQNSTSTTVTNSNEPVAGPSGINNATRSESMPVEDDNDDIEIIEYVKPEPEVVTLSSDDETPPPSGKTPSSSGKIPSSSSGKAPSSSSGKAPSSSSGKAPSSSSGKAPSSSSGKAPSSSSGKAPSSSDKTPSSSGKIPSSSGKIPSSSDKTPSSTGKIPSSSDKTPSSSGKIPSSSDKIPSSSDKTPSSSDKIPSSSDKTPSSSGKIPSSSGNQRNKSMKKSQPKDKYLDDTSSESSDFSRKRSRSCNQNKKNKNKLKPKPENYEEQKNKFFSRSKKRSSSSSSSSSSHSSSSSSISSLASAIHCENICRKNSVNTRYALAGQCFHGDSASCTSSNESVTGRDVEQRSKMKRKKLSKAQNKKLKRTRSPQPQPVDSNHDNTKKNKVKSCVVVPKSERNTEMSHTCTRNGETSSHHSGNSRNENEIPSYWALVLSDNPEIPWWRMNN